MKINEILTEDDYYPRERDDRRTEDELQQFLDDYVENHLGAPHKSSTRQDMGVIISIPHQKKRDPSQRWDYDGQREEWLETSEDLTDELDRAGFGRYELATISASYIELSLKHLNETTTAGGIATVSGGLAPAFTRNASVYGSDKPKKKKKKAGKYANSKD